MGAGVAVHLAQQHPVVELLGAPILDLAQPRDELVPAALEAAEIQQAGHAGAARGDVAAQAPAGAGAEVVDDEDGQLLLEPGDLPAQGATGGVLVALEAAAGNLRREQGTAGGLRRDRGGAGRDGAEAGGAPLVLDLLQSFDPAHPPTSSAVAV